MNVCDRNEMRALLAKHGFHFSKAKGQNFLAAAWVPEQIAVEAGVGPDCGVVEIGPGNAPAPVSKELQDKILGEGGQPVDCRIEDQKRTGEDFAAAKEALGDLAQSEEDVMSYICFPDQTKKFLEARKAKQENIATYVIEEA